MLFITYDGRSQKRDMVVVWQTIRWNTMSAEKSASDMGKNFRDTLNEQLRDPEFKAEWDALGERA